MDNNTKAKLGEIYEGIDQSLAKIVYAVRDDMFRWFIDKLEDKLSQEELIQLMQAFMDEKSEHPDRQKYMEAYREYLSNLVKR